MSTILAHIAQLREFSELQLGADSGLNARSPYTFRSPEED